MPCHRQWRRQPKRSDPLLIKQNSLCRRMDNVHVITGVGEAIGG